ncbi:hypothetical protein Bca52824_006577 [Brassica carinata]|uniref:Complex III subunit VI n=1 Tax=Brassica carinata TaxID=52824 RepID=A0A8X7W4S0_BRACI|nr:hypothetical protein Bca52824_006577 [Brassica carinata]
MNLETSKDGPTQNSKQICRVRCLLQVSISALGQDRADEEVVDPKKCLEESCKPKCVKPLLEYQACVKRIQGDESGHKHCTGQYFDYWQCVDKCVSSSDFSFAHLLLLGYDTEMKLDFVSSGCT